MNGPDFPAIQQGDELVRHGRFFRELRILLMSPASVRYWWKLLSEGSIWQVDVTLQGSSACEE